MKQSKVWVWDECHGSLIEVTDLYHAPPSPRVHLQTDGGFDGLRATDGTDISSRVKWNQYMRENNLTLANDFKETWAGAAKHREMYRHKYSPEESKRVDEAITRTLEMNPKDVAAVAQHVREKAANSLPDAPVGEGGWE